MAANTWQDQANFSGPYGGSSSYDTLYNQILGNLKPTGGVWDYGATQNVLDQYGNDFSQQFQNAVGRPPTADEINQFYQKAVTPVLNTQSGFSSTDPNAVVSQYIPQAYQTQIQQNQISQLPGLEQQIAGLSSNVGAETARQLADPNSGAYQEFSGSMNNLGITPSSGAFQAGEGATVGNAASQTMQNLLSSLGGGAIAGAQSPTFQGIYGQGQQAGAGLASNNQNLYDFNLQSELAKQLANEGNPSGAQSALGMASGSAQGLGSLLQGGASVKNATSSYVCREMMKRGLLCESDLEDFYYHMFDAVWYKARAFWSYKVNGQKLVDAANAKGVDWSEFKPLLFDRVMDEKDPCKSIDLFSDACRQLCDLVAPELWDERVMRTSWMDSLPFIPLLFTEKTFGKNFWRILHRKMLWIYDKPTCQVHR